MAARSGIEAYLEIGSALALLLLILEWIQRYLPGRTPDISDALLVLIAATALSFC